MAGTTVNFRNAVATNYVGTTGAATSVPFGSIFSGNTGCASSSTFVGGSGGTAGSTFSCGSGGTALSSFSGDTSPLTFSVGIGSTSSDYNSGSTAIVTNSIAGTLPTDRDLEDVKLHQLLHLQMVYGIQIY